MGILLLLFIQIGIGLLNVLLLAPIWLQILHLLVADMFWISLVLASAALVLEHPYARSGGVTAPCTEYREQAFVYSSRVLDAHEANTKSAAGATK